ncbi:MAG: NAD(P)H-binding protein [Segetibacter sp.]|nr:NAD(P)H-binding protein [Segetibacter sp.]
MRLTIFGATGMVGKHIVRQALASGHYVKAFGRNVESLIDDDLRNENFEAVKGYVFDENDVFDAVKGSNAVLSALGGSFDGTDKTRSLGIKNIVSQMEKAGVKRIVALGGLGILNADDNSLIMDKPTYPKEFLPVGKEHLQAYLYLKNSNLDWTIVGSPDLVEAEATGEYVTAADRPPTPNVGKINAGNLALFMVSEVAQNQYLHHRVGISNAL